MVRPVVGKLCKRSGTASHEGKSAPLAESGVRIHSSFFFIQHHAGAGSIGGPV